MVQSIGELVKAIVADSGWLFLVGIATLVALPLAGWGTYLAIKALRKQALSDEERQEIVNQVVEGVKEVFNHYRAPPSDEALRRLAAESGRRENLAKAVALVREDKHQEAVRHLEACLGPELAPDDRASIYLLIGNAHMVISQLVQAEAAYKNALAAAEGIEDAGSKKEATAAALGNLGLVYRQQGELDKALEHHRQALEIAKEIGHRRGEAAQLCNRGLVYRQQGELDKALEHHQQALEIDKETGNRLGEANALGNLGLVYRYLGDLEKALNHHQQALEIHRVIGHRLGEASDLGNLGIVYRQQGELDKALEYHQQALEIHREIGHRIGEAQELGNLGLVYSDAGELDRALNHHQQALEIDKEIGSRLGEAQDLGNLGDVYFQQGELDKSLSHHQQALPLFQAIGAQREIAIAKEKIAAVRKAIGRQKARRTRKKG
jgi:tetratricopeptide (TPR) repeat protein